MNALKKRSFSLSGHRTSVALEAEFWTVLEAEAVARIHVEGSALEVLARIVHRAYATVADEPDEVRITDEFPDEGRVGRRELPQRQPARRGDDARRLVRLLTSVFRAQSST